MFAKDHVGLNMKKLLLVSTILTAAVLAGCNGKDKTPAADSGAGTPAAQSNTSQATEKTVKYITEDNLTFKLKTNDNFTTATLEDNHGNSYALKNAPAGSGMLLEGENGVSVHTKGKEGMIEIANKVFNVKEVQ